MKQKILIVIAGPTAVGKTGLCIRLAQDLKCEIVSADSRQFFRELNIGTAKPTPRELQGARHHLVDHISMHEDFSAGKFETATLQLLKKLYKTYDHAIMTGGSGMYIQAVCEGMNEMPEVDMSFRDSLYQELEIHGLQALLEELKTKDPAYYAMVDHQNPQRIVRALEMCRATGMPYSSFRTDRNVQRPFKTIKIGLNRPREVLFERIDQRVDAMIAAGLMEEARQLYGFRHLNALKTVGYKEIFGYLDGKYDRTEAIRLLKRNTRRYAKRQLTWFKKDTEFHWFHPADYPDILKYITKKMP